MNGLAALLACFCLAQPEAAPRPFVTMSVLRTSLKKDKVYTWTTSWGSFHRITSSGAVLALDFKNIGKAAFTGHCAIVFFGKSERMGHPRPFDAIIHKIALPPNGHENWEQPTPGFEKRDENYEALGLRTSEGEDYAGCLVVLTAEKRVLKVWSTKKSLEAFAADYQRFARLVNAFTDRAADR